MMDFETWYRTEFDPFPEVDTSKQKEVALKGWTAAVDLQKTNDFLKDLPPDKTDLYYAGHVALPPCPFCGKDVIVLFGRYNELTAIDGETNQDRYEIETEYVRNPKVIWMKKER